jgi:protein phosphatase
VLLLTALGMLLLGLLVGAAVSWYTWSQSQYFVGTSGSSSDELVAIYRGPSEPLFGIDLSRLVETSTVPVSSLPEFEQEQVASSIAASTIDDARDIVSRLRTEATSCAEKNPPAGCPESP